MFILISWHIKKDNSKTRCSMESLLFGSHPKMSALWEWRIGASAGPALCGLGQVGEGEPWGLAGRRSGRQLGALQMWP